MRRMSRRHGWIGIVVAVPGLAACLLAIVGFFWRIVTNALPFHPMLSAREHYQAVGRAYGNGFLTGFFLCFFLVLAFLAASAILTWRRGLRRMRAQGWSRDPITFPKRSA